MIHTARRWLPALAAPVALSILAGCGGSVDQGGASPQPKASVPPLQSLFAGAQLVAGIDQRVAIGIVNSSGIPVPDVSVTVQLFTLPSPGQSPTPLGPAEPAPYHGQGLQGKGVYVIHHTFAGAGNYTAGVTASKGGISTRTAFSFNVSATDPTPAIGSPAPRTRNLTSPPAPIESVDTGVPPDDMHYTTVAAAIAAHHPVVVYFGSPGFCASKLCGPEVDIVKSLEASYRAKGVDFVHVETYKGGHPDNSDLAKATTNPEFAEWNLQTDPWVFVVGRDGNVAGKFDGPVEAAEISPTVDRVLA